jgi:hypothetical protein
MSGAATLQHLARRQRPDSVSFNRGHVAGLLHDVLARDAVADCVRQCHKTAEVGNVFKSRDITNVLHPPRSTSSRIEKEERRLLSKSIEDQGQVIRSIVDGTHIGQQLNSCRVATLRHPARRLRLDWMSFNRRHVAGLLQEALAQHAGATVVTDVGGEVFFFVFGGLFTFW